MTAETFRALLSSPAPAEVVIVCHPEDRAAVVALAAGGVRAVRVRASPTCPVGQLVVLDPESTPSSVLERFL
jgi:hypothetical protein